MYKRLLPLILIILIVCCTEDYSEQKKISIVGNLSNLPDGDISLLSEKRTVIEKQHTENGMFVFYTPIPNTDPPLVELEHIDNTGVKRLLHFKTKVAHGKMLSQYIFLEDGIKINGKLVDFNPINIEIDANIKMVLPDSEIQTGRQTRVMFADSLQFGEITDTRKLKELIELHPYSYYYLYELGKKTGSFNDDEIFTLLKSFDKELQESKTGQELRKYIATRTNKKLNFNTLLIDKSGEKQTVLQRNAEVNMVILWASWCGPCRKEIPQLKKVHTLFGSNPRFSMVSISLDDNKDNWQKALVKEQMPWRQLLMTEEANVYAKELFSFDGSIPTTLFVDSNGKIIKKFKGYQEKSLEEFKDLINSQLDNK